MKRCLRFLFPLFAIVFVLSARADTTLVFNEVMYHPATNEPALEWVELRNQLAVDLDVSGWSLGGGIQYTFADGTIIRGGGLVVVALSPTTLQSVAGIAGVRGPFLGRLSNNGDTLQLINNSGRVVDEIDYGVDGKWPVAPDGSGVSLAKLDRDSGSAMPENWVASEQIGGTPGLDNFPFVGGTPADIQLVASESAWKYDGSGTDLGTAWRTAAFNDSAWASGSGWFYRGPVVTGLPRPIRTLFSTGVSTNGTALAPASSDPHYTVVTAAQGPIGGQALVIENHPSWLGNDTESRWLGVANPGSGNVAFGNYAWKTTFDLSPYLPGTANLNFGLAVDDSVTAVLLNGVLLNGATATGFAAFSSPYTINSGLNTGLNTLEFQVLNGSTAANPSGLRVKMAGTASQSLTNTALSGGANTHYFRSTFNFNGDPAAARLRLSALVDDGAVFYLNGVEVFRANMAAGTVNFGTPAASDVANPAFTNFVEVSAANLHFGANVLAVEVHQAAGGGSDVLFDAALTATPLPAPPITLAFNELSISTNGPFWLELHNFGTNAIALNGYGISVDGSFNALYTFSGGLTLQGGGFLAVSNIALGFFPQTGDKLFLLPPARNSVIDGVVVKRAGRGRSPNGTGRWLWSTQSSPGVANTFQLHTEIVINEIMYHHRAIPGTNGAPPRPSNEAWVELYNRSGSPVNLTGWRFNDGIDYTFATGRVLAANSYLVVAKNAEALRALYPGVDIVGDFSGQLSGSGDNLVLDDPLGNPADEVFYRSLGRWPEYADGGGSSLELRNPNADNAPGEAWAASDESTKTTWANYSYRMVAQNLVGPVQWNDFILGGLTAGEWLVDDISVIDSPTNNPVQLIANGDFQNGQTGWRFLGTHRQSRVIADPTNPGNQVLHVIATGPQEHMHNHIETTYVGGRTVQNGREYEISYRAKWVAGGNFLNTRLYFDRVPRSTVLPAPLLNGTPGAQNSRFEPNIGPTFSGLAHSPVVPQPGEAVTVSVQATDPNGVSTIELWQSVSGGAWASTPMTLSGGNYRGTIPGQTVGQVVQFYVRAVDSLGAEAVFPARGSNSGALFAVADGQANFASGHNLRVIMTPANTDLLHALTNVMSNDDLPGTMVYDERRATYDIAVRLKGSERGRFNDTRVSFHIGFPPEDLFRGVHPFMLLDRSGAGDSADNKQQEILVRHIQMRAGNIPGTYPDLARIIAPRPAHTGSIILSPRYEDEFLHTAFANGGEGNLHELELIYYPTTANQFGYKLPSPDNVTGVDMTDLGDDKETYRYDFSLKNNRDLDDFRPFIAFAKSLALSGDALDRQTKATMDVDEWLRAFAMIALTGINDMYSYGNNHNLMMYVRASDQRVLAFPWDMDFSFNRASNSEIYGDQNLQKVILLPANFRAYAAHLLQIMDTVFNTGYMGYWVDHYDNFTPNQNYSAVLTYIGQRNTYVRSRLAALGGNTPFVVAGTNDLTVSSNFVTFTGTAPFEARTIRINGIEYPITWTSTTAWRLSLPLTAATNQLSIVGYNLAGQPIATMSNSVTIRYTGTPALPEEHVVINEIMYHPTVPQASYVELFNTSSDYAFDLTGYRLNGVDYVFPPGSYIAPRGLLVLGENRAVFGATYGYGVPFFAEFNGRLDPDGETLSLIKPGATSAQDEFVDQVRYENKLPWAAAANGQGAALQLIDANQDNSRPSNWADGSGWRFFSFTGRIGGNRLFMYINAIGDLYVDNISVVTGAVAEVGANLIVNGSFESPLAAPWVLIGNHSNSTMSSSVAFSGAGSLHIISTGVGSGAAAVTQQIPGIDNNGTYTLSFWFLPSSVSAVTTLTARFGSNFRPDIDVRPTPATPGSANPISASLPPYPDLWLNEIQPNNVISIRDGAGDRDPWLELYNGGTTNINLQGYFLSSSYSNLTQWAFPAGASIAAGQFKIIWLDGEPGESSGAELHTSFRLAEAGSLALARTAGAAVQLVDYLNYSTVGPALSYGDYPDGQPFRRPLLFTPTPGTTNQAREVTVFINEILASNLTGLTDPADDQHDDWFELYNPTTNAVDLTGFRLTDDFADKSKYVIPAGYSIPARGYLLVWADEQTAQNNSNRVDLHVNFRLSGLGEVIGLYTPEGTVVDELSFGSQTNDVSYGRVPDGTSVLATMPVPSPREANFLGAGNNAPTLAALDDRAVAVGQALTFTAQGSDSDVPAQALTYSLDAGAPASASINATSGLFSWTPAQAAAGTTNTITVRVTDNGVPARSATRTFKVIVTAGPQLAVSRSGNELAVRFPTIPGRTYRLQFKNDLNETQWSPLGADRLAATNSLVVTDTISPTGQRFYRILQVD